ncbi:MAG: folylpolyglutamate synthase/dihydrofolate synthase family protein [Candidatus Altiarchaeota archaeon]
MDGVSYEQSIEFLGGLEKEGINLRLEAVLELLAALDNPQENLKTIVVAGTNGKGSTSAMISAILEEEGYKVGLYTSPHLNDFTERILVNRCQIKQEKIGKLMARIMSVVESMRQDPKTRSPTFFEVLTALAFCYFNEESVDFAVLEVGLGGRLDATNVTLPLVTVITDISVDHTKYLGDTIGEIAGEKAGVIKDHGSVVSSVTDKKALKVIEDTCKERGARLFQAGQDKNIGRGEHSLQGQEVRITSLKGAYDIFIPLLGEFQIRNAACAVAAVESLIEFGYNVSKESIENGIAKTSWPVRVEIVSKEPLTVIDGAHNPAAMKELASAIIEFFSFEKLYLIIGVMSYKDISSIVAEIAPLANFVVATQAKVTEAAHGREILKYVLGYTSNATMKDDVREAVEHIQSLAGPKDLILVTGSLAVAAEARRIWKTEVQF